MLLRIKDPKRTRISVGDIVRVLECSDPRSINIEHFGDEWLAENFLVINCLTSLERNIYGVPEVLPDTRTKDLE